MDQYSPKDLKKLEKIFFSRLFDNRDDVINAAIKTATTIAQKSPIAVQGSKINLNYARDHTVDDNFNFTVTNNENK